MTNTNDFSLEANAALRLNARSPHGRGAVLKLVVETAAEPADMAAARSFEEDDLGYAPSAGPPSQPPSIDGLLAAVRPRMYAVALRLTKNHDDAEDVVQEALLKAWRNVARFEGRAAFSTWIHRIVVNAALDRLRSRRPEVSTSAGAGGRDEEEVAEDRSLATSSPETPEDLVESAEIGAAVHRAMGALSPVHRDALALRELDGESYQSIARIVRCPIGTVMSRLHHARHRLAEEIGARYAELHPRAA